MIYQLLFYFLLTAIIEFVIVFLIIRKNFLKILFYVLLINLFTWPLANLFFGLEFNFFIIELGVIFTESILIMLLFQIRYKKAILISLFVNIITALISFILMIIT